MTDAPGNRRLDLRALDLDADAAHTDAAVRNVLARIRADRLDDNSDALLPLVRTRRALLAAAAVLVAVAAGAVAAVPRRAPDPRPADVIATWAQSNHVPSNAELLTAFQGYRP